MSDIRIFKLASGEEIVADATDHVTFWEISDDAVVLVYHQIADDRMSVGFAPFMPYGTKVRINSSAVIAVGEPTAQILAEYQRIHSRIQVVAPGTFNLG